jgi:hypothetical protein
MAFSLVDLWLVTELKRKGYVPAGAPIVEIGAQQVDRSTLASNGDLEELGRLFGVTTRRPHLGVGPSRPGNCLAGAPMARQIWEWIGFEYAAIDIDGSPESIPLDLNFDHVPEHARERYGIVTNFGTTEHLTNQLNAFSVIHDLAAVDGLMIHHLPYCTPEHGFFGYNLKFFWALARSNEYSVLFHRLYPQDKPESVQIVLQKRHGHRFLPPLDVDDASTTDDQHLLERYWSIFDRQAIMKLSLSKEAQIREREAAVYLREQAAAAWERAHPTRLPPVLRLRVAVATHLPWMGRAKRALMRALTK